MEAPEDELTIEEEDEQSGEDVHVKILAGASHAFFQMLSMYPESHLAVRWCARWIEEAFDKKQGSPRSPTSEDNMSRIPGVMMGSWMEAELVPEQELMSRRQRDLAHPTA